MPAATEATILAIGLLYLGLTLTLQRKLVNVNRMRELRMKMSDLNKELKEMMKNKASQEAIMTKNKELMPIAAEQMRSSLKPMLIIPLFFILYYYLLPLYFGGVTVTINGVAYPTPYVLAVNRSLSYNYSFGQAPTQTMFGLSVGDYEFSHVHNGCAPNSNGAKGGIANGSITSNCTIEGFYGVNGVTFGTNINDNYVSNGIVLNVSYAGTDYSYLNNELPLTFGSGSGAVHYSYAQNVRTAEGAYDFAYAAGCGYNSTAASGEVNLTGRASPCSVIGYYDPVGGSSAAAQQSTYYVTFIGNVGESTGVAVLLIPLNYQSLFFYPVFVLGLIASLVIMKYDGNKIKQMKAAKDAATKQ